jgi:hypothetical protein
MDAMTRRRILCGLLLFLALLACFAGWRWVTRDPQLTRARFEQVKEGMSREEVIRTVGRPPGDYSSDKYMEPLMPSTLLEIWACDEAFLVVQFDDAGTATEVRVEGIIGRPATLTERIRRWLGL